MSTLIRYSFIMLGFLLANPVVHAQYDLTEEFEKFYLERQPPEKIMDLAGVNPGMTIGEIGAGRGRMTVYLAREVGPEGKIYANDIDLMSIAYLRGRCRRLGFNNVETITGEMDDPHFPEKSLDLAIMVLVYHMIDKPDKLLENLKKSLKPGAKLVIIDPVDEEIDREFGIDRSKPGTQTPTIRERISKSAINAGYEVEKVDNSLSRDIIFVLKPLNVKIEAGEMLAREILKNGIKAAWNEFEKIRNDTVTYNLSEMQFRTTGYEFIGSRSYPESIAILTMGTKLYPESSLLYAEMGETYMFQGDRAGSKAAWQKALDLDPGNPNGKYLLENFDSIFDQIHKK